MVGDKIGSKEVWTYQQDRHLGRREGILYFVLSLRTGFDFGVIPHGELLPHQGL